MANRSERRYLVEVLIYEVEEIVEDDNPDAIGDTYNEEVVLEEELHVFHQLPAAKAYAEAVMAYAADGKFSE